jgi:xylulokinase
VILTLDLGTSATKAVVWNEDGPVAMGRVPICTEHGPGGRAEQDPRAWFASVVSACADATVAQTARIDAVALTAARQTFVPVTESVVPLGPALVWSDRRAKAEARVVAEAIGGREAAHRRTGVVLDGASVAAKVAWLATHDAARLEAARWLLAPRDVVVHHLTGRVVTDTTLASATGLVDSGGAIVPELAGPAAGKLPDQVPPDTVVGSVTAAAARAIGVRSGVPVVIGAGDRASEAVGTAASVRMPMVSWGTTANLSVPVPEAPVPDASTLVRTRSAAGGWLLEGGTSAAGSLVDWLSRITGQPVGDLLAAAADAEPGAAGAMALAWPGGARAPWWRDGAGAALLGLSLHHGRGELSRAVVEGVARDLGRCLRAVADATGAAGVDAVALAGGGADHPLWIEVLTGIVDAPAVMRRSPEAASAGAAVLAGRAVGAPVDLDRMNPVVSEHRPDPALVERYRALDEIADQAAATVVDLNLGWP